MKTAAWCFIVPVTLASCCSTKEPVPPAGEADVAAVVDRVKFELNKFAQYGPILPTLPTTGASCSKNGQPLVYLVPTKAELTLKVASTNNLSGSIGAKIPVGKIVTVDPTFSGSYQTVGTHSFTLNLDIQHKPSSQELQSSIDTKSKQIALYQKAQQALANSDRATAAMFAHYAALLTEELRGDYLALAAKLPDKQETVIPTTRVSHVDSGSLPVIPSPPADLSKYPLASTLWAVREQLLYVDHTFGPCVKPSSLTVNIDFEVVEKSTSDVGVDIFIVSVDASSSSTRDTIQHLAVTFDMSGSTQLLTNQAN
jgi:hypothetical protein